MQRYDAVVVGGSVAGATVGLELAKKGFSVLILDRKKEAGVPLQCGEVVSMRALSHYGMQIRDEWLVRETRRFKLITPNGKHFFMKK